MSNELVTVIEGFLIMIGVVVPGGAIYAGLQKIAFFIFLLSMNQSLRLFLE